jgi:Na+/H+ antiporter NhaC
MNASTTSTDAWQMFRRIYWTLAAAMALVLLLLAVLGFGPGGRNCKAESSAAAQAAPAVLAGHTPQRLSCGLG